jgi:hypothetical protein
VCVCVVACAWLCKQALRRRLAEHEEQWSSQQGQLDASFDTVTKYKRKKAALRERSAQLDVRAAELDRRHRDASAAAAAAAEGVEAREADVAAREQRCRAVMQEAAEARAAAVHLQQVRLRCAVLCVERVWRQTSAVAVLCVCRSL